MPKEKFLPDVRRATDGRLLASSFNTYTCDNCTGAHIDLQDQKDVAFCTAIIPEEAFRPLAAWFLELAEAVEKHTGKKLS